MFRLISRIAMSITDKDIVRFHSSILSFTKGPINTKGKLDKNKHIKYEVPKVINGNYV